MFFILYQRLDEYRYHEDNNPPSMVFMPAVWQHDINTMQNTIDDADYIINLKNLSLYNQSVINSRHSHSIINKPFLAFIFNDLFSC